MEKINIGLVGFGTVGQALYQVLARTANVNAAISRICVRSLSKHRDVAVPAGMLTDNVGDIIGDSSINLVVEVIDNADAAFDIACRAMRAGKDLVSGNKAMLAKYLPQLMSLQRSTGRALLYDASSCGSIPVIRNLEEYYDNDLLLEVKGILNGSSNYILSRVFDHGEDYGDALRRAQKLGFAESNPSQDICGYDSLNKLVIITLHALGVYVPPSEVMVYGIQNIGAPDIRYAREKGMKIKLVAQVAKLSDECFTMFVMPEFVAPNRYIYAVDDEYNGVVIRGECYDRQFMFGKGAGGFPTASSLLSDIMARRHDYRYEYKKTAFTPRPGYRTDVPLKIYARYVSTDLKALLPWLSVEEEYRCPAYCYVVGEIMLSDLLSACEVLAAPDIFLCNFSRFFSDRDDCE